MSISSEVEARILDLHKNGQSRNAIAREVQVSGSTVSRIVAAAGGTFDRTSTQVALAARQVDLEGERQKLVGRMLAEGNAALESLDGPFLVYNFGGRDNSYSEHLLDEAPIDARLRATQLAGIAFDKATRILEKSNPGLDGAVSILDELAAGFAAVVKQMDEQPAEIILEPAD